jgi:ubiquinol-cytochrome c reductase cytochrome b subunit
MPFSDLSRSRGLQFRPLSKIAFYIFIANFFILMILGAKHVESPYIEFGQISTVLYFAHFLIIVPYISLLENSLVELAGLNLTIVMDHMTIVKPLNSREVASTYRIQRRSFTTTRPLRMDEDPNAPHEDDSRDDLLIKRLELEQHKHRGS